MGSITLANGKLTLCQPNIKISLVCSMLCVRSGARYAVKPSSILSAQPVQSGLRRYTMSIASMLTPVPITYKPYQKRPLFRHKRPSANLHSYLVLHCKLYSRSQVFSVSKDGASGL